MNDDTRTNHEIPDRSIDWSRQPVAARLRALADDELPADHASDLRNEVDAEAIAKADSFERALRRSCSGCMSENAGAPAGLRQRVVDALRAEEAAHLANDAALSAAETQLAQPLPAETPSSGTLAPEAPSPAPEVVITRTDRSFWARTRVVMSLAAVMAIAAVVWVAVPSSPSSAPNDALALLAPAAQHASSEHHGCTIDASRFNLKLANVNPDAPDRAGAEYIAEAIGDVPVKLALGHAGYVLKGVGECHLPGPGKSVHLLYEPTIPNARPVSLFIQQASGPQRETLVEGTVYTSGSGTPPYVRVWRDASVVYYMVTECPMSCMKAESAYALSGERVEL